MTRIRHLSLQLLKEILGGESSSFDLLVPLLDPVHGAEVLVTSLELVAYILSVILRNQNNASLKLHIVGETVVCLVGVGETGVEPNRDKGVIV